MIKKYILALLASISCFAAVGCLSAYADYNPADYVIPPDEIVARIKQDYPAVTDYYCVRYDRATSSGAKFYNVYFFNCDPVIFPYGTKLTNSSGGIYTYSACVSFTIRFDSSDPSSFGYSSCPGSISFSNNNTYATYLSTIIGDKNNFYNSFDIICSNNSDYDYKSSVPSNAPFTVTCQPELFEGMSPNTATYPSKQGANGQNVTSEFYTLDVTVSLSDQFLTDTTPISGSFIYSYFFTTFIVPEEYCQSGNIREMCEHAIYTSVTTDHYLYYENETLDVSMYAYGANATGEAQTVPVSEQWACANGATNCYVIDRSAKSKSFTIDMQHVPFEQSGAAKFKLVTLGHITRMSEYGWVAYPYYFKSTCSELALESKKEFPAEFATVVDGVVDENYTKWELYDYYTVVSDTFSYQSYPEYREQTNSEGQAFSKTPLDFKNVAAQVQDYNMHVQTGGEQEWRTESEFEEYKKLKEWGQNFSMDYNVGNITDLFNGESTFFGFITASISVLPSWFLTILSAFFVTLLAVAVIKFLI